MPIRCLELTRIRAAFVGFLLAAVLCVPSAQAGFLDITTLTSGSTGSFTGTLDGVSVTGVLTAMPGHLQFNGPGTDDLSSTIDNTSPQYRYSSVYTPFQAATDRVGYTLIGGTTGTAQLTIAFGQAITNPVFQVANLDSMVYDFSLTPGLTGLTLLSGNGGGGDGLTVNGLVIEDANPRTLALIGPTNPPPLTGGRSAYGSVQLDGTFNSLTINLNFNPNTPAGDGDGENFTLATVPEPSGLALLGCGVLIIALRRQFRRRFAGRKAKF